ncbi:HepT-like ribonuclease domain-containing protein [Leptolyngbya sp. BC1307]|uniref:HepT-like ribonuclease domain-containing protein n=1 Tax=Leptolyngbya sp. BC1307 TaxID=2029589 RepID=UPI000EFD85D1
MRSSAQTKKLSQPLFFSYFVFQLLVIGEATKRLSITLREQYPNIPWLLMAGMRDNLIHDYHGISIGEVWDTSEISMPTLLRSLEAVVAGPDHLRLTLEDES